MAYELKYFTEKDMYDTTVKGGKYYAENESFYDTFSETEHDELKAGADRAREDIGGRCKMSSGVRCLALNSAVGGKDGSDHTKCMAFDLQPLDCTVSEAYEILKQKHMNGTYFAKIIIERKSNGVEWIHITVATTKFKEDNPTWTETIFASIIK